MRQLADSDFDFTVRFRRASKYDWDTILNGSMYHITEEDHPESNDVTFGMQARKQGERRGLEVAIRKHPEGGIVLKATPASPKQVEQWKANREERSQKNRLKRLQEKAAADQADAAEQDGGTEVATQAKTKPSVAGKK